MDKRLLFLLAISAFGTGYSSVLSYSSLTSETCVFGSACPTLLSMPVCVYGAVGFLTIFVSALFAFLMPVKIKVIVNKLYWFALGGVFFMLYYLVQEVFVLSAKDTGISFGYPSCLYGFLLYLVLFLLVRSLASPRID